VRVASLLAILIAQPHPDPRFEDPGDERLDVAALWIEQVRLLQQVQTHLLLEVVEVRPGEVGPATKLPRFDPDEGDGEGVRNDIVARGHGYLETGRLLPGQPRTRTSIELCRDTLPRENTGAVGAARYRAEPASTEARGVAAGAKKNGPTAR